MYSKFDEDFFFLLFYLLIYKAEKAPSTSICEMMSKGFHAASLQF